MQQQKVQRILLLPSNNVPQQYIDHIADIKDFSIRFINGFRNVIQPNDNNFEWGLVPNQSFCGQSFCYLLKEQINETQFIQIKIKGSHKLQKINDQMLVLQSTYQRSNELIISNEQLIDLIKGASDTKQITKLSINLVKNSFNSYEQYQKCVQKQLLKIQQQQQSTNCQPIPTVAYTIASQFHAKRFAGQMCLQLPKCDETTGTWDDKQVIHIKLNE